MANLRKPLVTVALASSALGLSLGVGLDPADAAPHAGTTTTTFSSSSAATIAASSGLAVASLSRNTPDVEKDWTVEWQIMSTTSSSSAPGSASCAVTDGLSGATFACVNKKWADGDAHEGDRPRCTFAEPCSADRGSIS